MWIKKIKKRPYDDNVMYCSTINQLKKFIQNPEAPINVQSKHRIHQAFNFISKKNHNNNKLTKLQNKLNYIFLLFHRRCHQIKRVALTFQCCHDILIIRQKEMTVIHLIQYFFSHKSQYSGIDLMTQ